MDISIIGAGRIGTNHATILAHFDAVNSLLISDVDDARASDLADTLGTKGRAVGLDTAFTADAIVITSSTDTHAEFLIRAAHAGRPTFCEKPIALGLAETRSAVEAVDGAGIPVMMGFQRRYDPAMRAIHDAVAAGGAPYLVRSQTHDPEPPPPGYIPVSGGMFRDCLIHDIDVVRYVTGQEVVSVTAFGSTTGHPSIADHGDYGSVTAVLEMAGGTMSQLSGLRRDPMGYDVRLEVFTDSDAMAAGWGPRTPIRPTEPGVGMPVDPIVSFWDRFADAYLLELTAFIGVIEGTETPASTHHDAFENLRIAAACDLSASERRTVSMEEIAG